MTSLIGITAFVVDVGSWDRDHRSLQAVADAAALAGAEDLPYDQPGASALATSYATRNGGGTLSIAYPRSDTIQVTMST